MTVTISEELRHLAKALEMACLQSPACGPALPAVRCCVDHLNLLARLHELNAAPNPPGYGD